MISARNICTLCDFVYESLEKGAADGDKTKPPFDSLPQDWTCPNCDAGREFFQPCSCATFPSFELMDSEQKRSISQWMEDAEITDELFQIASAAEKHYEHSKSFAVPVSHFGRRIRCLAESTCSKRLEGEQNIMLAFFDGPALKEIEDHSINYYWFWRVVSQCAARADSLPIGVETVDLVIEEIRSGLSKQLCQRKQLMDLTRSEVALYTVYGVLVLKHEPDHSYSLLFNPLFKLKNGAIDPSAQLAQLALRHPERARIFERFGLDYGQEGTRTLEEACRLKGINLRTILRALSVSDLSRSPGPAKELAQASLTDLVDQIETTHHAFLKRQLPHLSFYISRIAALHGDSHPELKDVREAFENLKIALENHLKEEEEQIFVLCREIGCTGTLTERPNNLSNTMRDLQAHHNKAGELMRKIRLLLNNYAPPADACSSYCTLLEQLSEFEKDLHVHGVKENFVLYPGLRAIASGLRSTVGA